MGFDDIKDIGKRRARTKKKVAFSLDEGLIEEFNKLAKAKDLNKSAVMEDLLRIYLAKSKSLI